MTSLFFFDEGKNPLPENRRVRHPAFVELAVGGQLNIGDFAEDGWAGGPGGGGEIGGAVVKGLVGEESEGVGFFGLFGDVEVR